MQPCEYNYTSITGNHDAWLEVVSKLCKDMQSATKESNLKTIEECATAAIRTTGGQIVDLQLHPDAEKRIYKATKRLLETLIESEEMLPSDTSKEILAILSQAVTSAKKLKKTLRIHQQYTTSQCPAVSPTKSLAAKSPLSWDRAAIEELLSTKKHVDQVKRGYTPLAFAVMTNDEELIETLLQAGANPNQSIKRNPIIFLVLENCSEKTALRFLDAGANKSEINDIGMSILAKALNLKMFQLADALIDTSLPTSHANIALAQAIIYSGDDKYMDLFSKILSQLSPRQLSEQLLINAITANNPQALALLLSQKGVNINEFVSNNETPLIIAAQQENFACFELLLEAGANIEVLVTPLGYLLPELPATSAVDDLKATNSPHYHKILELLAKSQKKEILAHKEKFRISAVGHCCKLSGHVEVQPRKSLTGKHAQPFEAKLEFGAIPHWLKKMTKVTKLFSQKYPDLLPGEECAHLCDVLDFAAEWQKVDLPAILTRVHKGMPTTLITGYIGRITNTTTPASHCVMLNTYGPLLGVCNRRNPGTPIIFNRFNPDLLQKDQLLDLIDAAGGCEKEDFPKFLNQFLNSIKAEQKACDLLLQKACTLMDQQGSTCAWETSEGSVWNHMAFRKLEKAGLLEKMIQFPEDATLPEEIQRVIADVDILFYSWLAFNQMYHLERYIADKRVCVVRSSRSRSKKRGYPTSTRRIYKKNIELIKRSMAVILSHPEAKLDPRIAYAIATLSKKLHAKKPKK